ncbi:MAG: hydratase [Sphingobacteriia bacterium]|nr:hydratase [Sphingobacteriia bacterium]NCC40524.1 hydratase [Gammaproteobacteria bacterium]
MREPSILHLILIMAVSLLPPSPTRAACPGDDEVGALAAAILAARPATVPDLDNLEDAYCAQDKLVARLAAHWGAPVGYKAGLTGRAVQERFGLDEPVRGVLLADMLLESGAVVSASFGARPMVEADLIAVVGSDAINQASTPEQVLEGLSALHPFIELPDLMVSDPDELTAARIVAINVGARKGVLGEPIRMAGIEPRALVEALAEMSVRVTDQDGRILSSAPGSSVLDHPLNAVLWLRDSGLVLRAGDRISLGAFGPFIHPWPGLSVTVTYDGLPGTPQVSVRFVH